MIFSGDEDRDEGSPPPTRGTRIILSASALLIGITPAYAGNTTICFLVGAGKKDHPRLRGEHSTGKRCGSLLLGSPPPTRGTHKIHVPDRFDCRITPAYAGNTLIISFNPTPDWDHPRLRGEHTKNLPKTKGFPIPTHYNLFSSK